MGFWETIRRTGQRDAAHYLLQELAPQDAPAAPLAPGSDYFRVWLCEMFLAQRSTLLANWLPAASVSVTVSEANRPKAEYSRVLRPDLRATEGGVVLLDYPVTDLLPYNGGVVEVDAALLGLQTGTRLDLVVDLLQTISMLPVPGLDQAVTVARQVTTSTRELVKGTDGAVHLDLHTAWSSAPAEAGAAQGDGVTDNELRPTYVAALLATGDQVSVDNLRVVDRRLHQLDGAGVARHLLGWDFLLLRIEGRDQRDDFWLPELEDLLGKAVDALMNGLPQLAEQYRAAAVAAVWKSPTFTWCDRDRVIAAVHSRFDAVSGRGRGLAGRSAPKDLTELVEQYAPSLDTVRARGPLTPEEAFAGPRR